MHPASSKIEDAIEQIVAVYLHKGFAITSSPTPTEEVLQDKRPFETDLEGLLT